MRILLVSPAIPEAGWLHKAFQESAHSLQRAEDARDGLFLASHEPFDAVVVLAADAAARAVMLAAVPLFASLPNSPLVVVMVRSIDTQDRISVLRAGADACLSYPWSFIEIHERMLALHRSSSKVGNEAMTARVLPRLDTATRELVDGNTRLSLTKREYQLLECLLRQPNMPVPRDQLIRYAWSEKEDVDPASVNLVVSRLRRKLVQRFPYIKIETVSRFGYQISCTR
ncbi:MULTISPECIES: winged helix-turn-helix transcriptional regulator [Paraburkholderia]|jgi:DNA-binding response OmpR family regulator|uniref:winged helix-turn-helix transcriptional regulator n=1 Tax=Paraburkholderia TaxID=1822464 RepID=UPI000722D23A|nr:transcriptional regulator [Paraburkholderia caribensis]AUT54983.1 DNA-binding response regulator [Paraburkholderia caribensis]